ncbi:MAG TPA: TIGR01777 family oxidoreductase [Leptospiraceae bacterium]|nr:TIGR01777 family oxidoreductase [Leptospiraceae bacterium]
MKIAIVGGSGFIGRNLAKALHRAGEEVIIFSRKNSLPQELMGLANIHLVSTSKPSAKDLEGVEALVNLAGESVVGEKWSDKRKEALRTSRVDFTRSIVEELAKVKVKPKVLLQGSAIGYYGMHETGKPVFSEDAKSGEDFLAKLCVDWEEEANRAKDLGLRTVLIRTGIVLSPESGAMQQMLLPFKMFVGGPLGNGKQYMSWIHLADMIGAIQFLLANPKAEGPFNFTAPNPCSNEEFSTVLGKVLGRPSFMRVPSFPLIALYGEGAEVILKGQNVIPSKLTALGYQFQFSELKNALEDLLI